MSFLRGLTLVAAIATLSAAQARATVVVDTFTTTQTQIAPGTPTGTASGAGILGGTRTLTVFLDSVPPFSVGVGNVSGGVFSGSMTGPNSPVGGSFFKLDYATAAIDALTGNTALNFSASSQGGSTIVVTANGTSTATITVPDAPGFQFYSINLASFSNPSVFSALTSLSIKATFPNVTQSGPSLTINGPILISAIPEPSIIALGSVACVVLGGLSLRRKS